MTGKNENVDAPSAVRSRLASLTAAQRVPGTLTQWADVRTQEKYWEFVGDGKITGTDLMEHVVQREAEESGANFDPTLRSRNFAQFAASKVLGEGNEHYNPDAAIPTGKVEEIPLKKLVQAMAPYLERYAADMEKSGGVIGGGASDTNSVTGHRVYGQGLVLPISDP